MINKLLFFFNLTFERVFSTQYKGFRSGLLIFFIFSFKRYRSIYILDRYSKKIS